MWVRRLKGREVGRILRKNGIVGVVLFVWAKTAQTWWRGGSSEQILMCIRGRCSLLSSTQARLPWPGHFPWWVIWQWALILSKEKPLHDYYLPIVTLYLECHICAHGPAPPRGFRWAFYPTATALHGSLWLHPGPRRKQDVMFPSGRAAAAYLLWSVRQTETISVTFLPWLVWKPWPYSPYGGGKRGALTKWGCKHEMFVFFPIVDFYSVQLNSISYSLTSLVIFFFCPSLPVIKILVHFGLKY